MTYLIRDFEAQRDSEAALSFIDGSQTYEREVEPNRRVDDRVAAEYFPVLMKAVAARQGRILVAEDEGRVVGWAAIVVEENPLFVVEAERRFGYITELYVDETMRGRGVGQALIAACEDEARARGLNQVMIGVLSESKRTAEIYAEAGYRPYSMELRKYL